MARTYRWRVRRVSSDHSGDVLRASRSVLSRYSPTAQSQAVHISIGEADDETLFINYHLDGLNNRMTMTEVPPKSPLPTNDALCAEQPANTEASIVNQASEPGQAFQVADEQSRDDRPQTENVTTENLSPEAQSLKAMFPDIDTSIIEAVLQPVNGNQKRAADVLLGMSDPNYVSQQPSARTQTELDEEFARRLVMEEQQRQANWHPGH